jgi:ribokinase
MPAAKGITVIGSSNVDMIMRLPHLPAVGETVTEGEFLQTYGGKGANQAVAAARAGGGATVVTFVTGVGGAGDLFAPKVLENFRADGIDVSRVLEGEGQPCGSALVMFDGNGDNYLAVAPGANFAITPAYIDAHCGDLLKESAMLVLQMEIPAETVAHVLRKAREYGTPTLFNYAPARALGEVPIDGAITGLVVNENEAAALVGSPVVTAEDARTAAEALLARGPSFVAVTLGADGAFLADQGGLREYVPSFPVTPVDTTAAGDTFCGALAVALVEGCPLPEAARFASAASALSVTRMGAQPSVPRRGEIDAFLAGKGAPS